MCDLSRRKHDLWLTVPRKSTKKPDHFPQPGEMAVAEVGLGTRLISDPEIRNNMADANQA